MGNAKKIRNSNLELLRIISMVLIIAHHYAIHGFSDVELTYSLNRHILGVLSLGGKLGVSCFILISGYFLVNSKFTVCKLLKLVGEVWIYSVGIGLLFLTVLTPEEPIDKFSLIEMFFPIGFGKYWFMTDYILLMLMSPLLNLVISKISRTAHKTVIFVSVLIWSVMPVFTFAEYDNSDILWFISLYFIAGYIRKEVNTGKKNSGKHLFTAIASYMLVIISNAAIIIAENYGEVTLGSHTLGNRHFAQLNSPLILITSVELLIGFIKMKPHHSAFINTIASATLGVYLIHDNYLVRPYLWNTLLKASSTYRSDFFIVYALLSIAAVYVVCTVIDLIRQNTIERLYLMFLDKYLGRIEEKVIKIKNRVSKKLSALLLRYYK